MLCGGVVEAGVAGAVGDPGKLAAGGGQRVDVAAALLRQEPRSLDPLGLERAGEGCGPGGPRARSCSRAVDRSDSTSRARGGLPDEVEEIVRVDAGGTRTSTTASPTWRSPPLTACTPSVATSASAARSWMASRSPRHDVDDPVGGGEGLATCRVADRVLAAHPDLEQAVVADRDRVRAAGLADDDRVGGVVVAHVRRSVGGALLLDGADDAHLRASRRRRCGEGLQEADRGWPWRRRTRAR